MSRRFALVLFLARHILSPLPMLMKVPASRHGGKATAAYLLKNCLCYHIRCFRGLYVGGADTANTFKILVSQQCAEKPTPALLRCRLVSSLCRHIAVVLIFCF